MVKDLENVKWRLKGIRVKLEGQACPQSEFYKRVQRMEKGQYRKK